MENVFIPKYCDAQSIFLVNCTGAMRKLYCPFKVKSLEIINEFKRDTVLWVEQVASSGNDDLIYWILGKPYLHTYFEIKASF